MLTFSNDDIMSLLRGKHDASALPTIESIDFLPFGDLDKSVRDDVRYLKEHPLITNETTITGWVYDVQTGKVCILTRQLKRALIDYLSDKTNYMNNLPRWISGG